MLHKQFENHLTARGIQLGSVKNYMSDLTKFLSWAKSNLKSYGTYIDSLNELLPFLRPDLVNGYKNDLVKSSVQVKTANRRLSTLRALAKFFISTQVLDFDFMDGVTNIGHKNTSATPASHPLIENFASHLKSQNISDSTIKNYASDVRQFLAWLDRNQHAHPA